jgi:AraC-like DNA-binding protein
MHQVFEPANSLRSYVECYWSWSLDPASDSLDPLLPDAAPEFLVHLGSIPCFRDRAGRLVPQAPAFLYCAASRSVELIAQGPMEVFSIRFRPWGVRRFSTRPMAELLDREVLPREVFADLGDALAHELSAAEGNEAHVAIADRLLGDALALEDESTTRIQDLAAALRDGGDDNQNLASRLAMSERSFRRLWRDVVGLSPQRYTALMRFHRAISMIDSGERLAVVAADCGYCDQPHMARQIKAVSGLPASLLGQRLGSEVFKNLYGNRPTAPWRN